MVEYEPGLTTNLLGYTSTSKDFATALKFAFEDYKNDKTPVVFEILFKGNNGIFELTKGYSAYPGEQEVLIQDGLTYLVKNKTQNQHPTTNNKFYQITLQYPAH